MPRPKRCRRICGYPSCWSFAPEGVNDPETIDFKLDEYEVIRLIDHEKMTQEECAKFMGVSRATVTSIYENARFKISDAMVCGKRIRITGGSYMIDSIPASIQLNEDGMVGQHFGKTEQFKVYDVAEGAVKSSQVIDTNGTGHGALAGFLRAAEVETLICGGIGMGARNALEEVGIRLLPGVTGNVDKVVADYLADKLNYDPNTECHHHDHEHGEGHECHHGDCGSHGCH